MRGDINFMTRNINIKISRMCYIKVYYRHSRDERTDRSARVSTSNLINARNFARITFKTNLIIKIKMEASSYGNSKLARI